MIHLTGNELRDSISNEMFCIDYYFVLFVEVFQKLELKFKKKKVLVINVLNNFN